MRVCYTVGMRTTITIDDKVYARLKKRAFESNSPISQYVENAVVYQLLEDMEDLEAVEQRKNEPTYSFDKLVKELKAEGLL
jgi:predicted DNA-binding protein